MPHITISHRGMLYKMVPIDDFQTLHEVLVKFSVDHPDVDVTTHQFHHRRLGLANMKQAFRLTGLETNAQLETVEIPINQRGGGIIKIAVQVEGGGRLTAEVPPKSTLWECLVAAGSSNNEDLVGKVDATGVYLMPSLSMQAERKEYADLLSLNRTTLNDLGISKGSVLMRLKLKASEPPLTLAQVQEQLVSIEQAKKTRVEARDKARAEAADKKAVEDAHKTAIRARRDDEARAAPVDEPTEESKLRKAVDRTIAILQVLKASAPAADYFSTLTLLAQITNNLVKFPPMDDNAGRYRSISLTNPVFAAKIARFPSAVDYLRAIGFTPKSDEASRLVLLFADEDTTLLTALLPPVASLVDAAKLVINPSLSPAPLASPSANTTSPPTVVTPTSSSSSSPSPTAAVISSKPSQSSRSSGMGLGETNSDDDKDNDDYRPPRRNYDDNDDMDENDDDDYSTKKKAKDTSAAAAATTKKAKLIGEQAPLDYDDDETVSTTPDYDLGDVRRAVSSLETEFTDVREFLNSMKTLIMITEKLQTDKSPAVRTFSLTNAKFNEKVGGHAGALAYLSFLGFEKTSTGEQLVMNPTSEHKRKTDRALSVLRMLVKEKTPSVDDLEVLELGPIERQSAIYEFDAKTSLTAALPSATEAAPVVSEAALVLGAHRAEAKRNRELFPTDTIVFRKHREEDMKSKRARRYPAALIRVQFPDNIMLLGYFRPWETLDAVHTWIADHLKPSVTEAPTTPSPTTSPSTGTSTAGSSSPASSSGWYVMAPPVKFQFDQRHQTLKQLSLVPSAMLIFKCHHGSSAAIDVLATEVYGGRRPFDHSSHVVPVPLNKDTLDAAKAKEKAEFDQARRDAQIASVGGSSFMSSRSGAAKPSSSAKDDPRTAKLRGLLGKK